MSFSAYNNAKVNDMVEELVMFYLPEGGLVFDPTCGIKNRQFKWIQNSRLDGVKYEYLPGDIQESNLQKIQASVRHIPLKYRSVDLTLYDPPYLPGARECERKEDYGIETDQSVKETIAFYSKEIFEELKRITRKWIIIKGTDFYYPTTSMNFYVFQQFALKGALEAGLKVRAIYSFGYHHGNIGIYRARLRNYRRPVNNFTYYIVLSHECCYA